MNAQKSNKSNSTIQLFYLIQHILFWNFEKKMYTLYLTIYFLSFFWIFCSFLWSLNQIRHVADCKNVISHLFFKKGTTPSSLRFYSENAKVLRFKSQKLTKIAIFNLLQELLFILALFHLLLALFHLLLALFKLFLALFQYF